MLCGCACGNISIAPVLLLAGGAHACHVMQNERFCLCEQIAIDTEKRQQIRQFISGMRALPNKHVKVGGLDVELSRDFCDHSAVEFSHLQDISPSPAPIAKGINDFIDDRKPLAHCPLRWLFMSPV
jgi:hypothetical protein